MGRNGKYERQLPWLLGTRWREREEEKGKMKGEKEIGKGEEERRERKWKMTKREGAKRIGKESERRMEFENKVEGWRGELGKIEIDQERRRGERKMKVIDRRRWRKWKETMRDRGEREVEEKVEDDW